MALARRVIGRIVAFAHIVVAFVAAHRRQAGEIVALVGVVVGLVAVWTTFYVHPVSKAALKYADDGTIIAAAVIVLGFVACCLLVSLAGVANLDLVAATAGAIGFGFLLLKPAQFAFQSLSLLEAGAWLGVCSGLIPLGAGYAHFVSARAADSKPPRVNLGTALVTAGFAGLAIGVWFAIEKGTVSYWDASTSKHALGFLMLGAVAVSVLILVLAVVMKNGLVADLALIVSGISVGLAVAVVILKAFGSLGQVGTGGWIELSAALALLLGLVAMRLEKVPSLGGTGSA
jgi:hypothetical protein